jgi:hypothetical protein
VNAHMAIAAALATEFGQPFAPEPQDGVRLLFR